MIDETQPVGDQTPKPGYLSSDRDGSTSIRPRNGLLDFSPTQPCRSRLTTPSPGSPLPSVSNNDDIDTQLLQKLVLSANDGDDTEMLGATISYESPLLLTISRYGDAGDGLLPFREYTIIRPK